MADVFSDISNSLMSTNAPSVVGHQVGFGLTAQQENKYPGDTGGIAASDIVKDMISHPFWVTEAIDPTRWDKRYPYQLLVLTSEGGKYVRDAFWEFTLPIPPEALSIGMPPAMTVTATLDGVVEEGGGAPFRTISISGTTGVMPNRDSSITGGIAEITGLADVGNAALGLAEMTGVFAGTARSVTQTAQAASARIGGLAQPFVTGLGLVQSNLMDQTSLNTSTLMSAGRGTGYYQMRLMAMFLEAYLNLRKTPFGKNKRLALAMWKDQAVYIVTPTGSFDVRRTASDPLAYHYSLTMKAWRRVSTSLIGAPGPLADYGHSTVVGAQAILGGILAARAVLEGGAAAIRAVQVDIDGAIESVRQVGMLAKDGAGVAQTAGDVSQHIVDLLGAAINQVKSTIDVAAYAAAHGSGLSAARPSKEMAQRDSRQASSGGAVQTSRLANRTLPTAKTEQTPYSLLSTINLSSLEMTPATRQRIQEERDRVKRTTRLDIEKMRDRVLAVAADFADRIGEGSVTLDETLGRTPKPQLRESSLSDHEILWAFNSVAQEMARLARSLPQHTATVQAVDMVAGLASRSGIAFRRPTSKFSVSFPYGATIEQLALRYLGDANRWHEIVTLNGLRSPYVDEEGFSLPLLANGSGRTVAVSSPDNLYAGQLVTITAVETVPTQRRITGITPVSDTLSMIRLDGEPDLDRYHLGRSAILHAYRPDTVNSRMQLFIPSQEPVTEQLTTRKIPGVPDFANTVERGGVDLLLTTAGDAAITSDGDWKVAVGLANIVQRVRIAFLTPRGSLPQHPGFGLGLDVGMSTADIDANQALAAARGMFAGDPDFTGVHAVRVEKVGPGIKATIGVGVTQQQTLLPVSLEITR